MKRNFLYYLFSLSLFSLLVTACEDSGADDSGELTINPAVLITLTSPSSEAVDQSGVPTFTWTSVIYPEGTTNTRTVTILR